jgi:hypothetical protein
MMKAKSAFDFGASTPAGEKRGSLIKVALSSPSQWIEYGGLNFIWSLAYRTFDAVGGLTALTGTAGLLRPDLGYKNSLMM